jgi:hypothetical protein
MPRKPGVTPATIGIDTRSRRRGRRGRLARSGAVLEIDRVTHLTLANYYESGHLHRIAGRSLSDHIAAMRATGTPSPTCSSAS